MKKIFTILTLFVFTSLFAQLPSYVPINGLVGYWPFNGNTIDESPNGNNATNIGAILALDRFSNSNKAYYFDGINCPIQKKISTPNTINNLSNYSVNVWYKSDDIQKFYQTIFNSYPHHYIDIAVSYCSLTSMCSFIGNGTNWGINGQSNNWEINNNTSWHNLTMVKSTSEIKYYVDGLLKKTTAISSSLSVGSFNLNFGSITINGGVNCYETFKGTIDDIGIWNRALTQEEITNLYLADTTCQSLVINTGILSFNPVTFNNNKITIYPNPAKDQITIDCGNISSVSGWNYTIVNTLGQEVSNGVMNSQQNVVSLNTLNGTGVYLVKIFDAESNLISTKKIIKE
jgi:hypothetical protein